MIRSMSAVRRERIFRHSAAHERTLVNHGLRPWLGSFAAPRLNNDAAPPRYYFLTVLWMVIMRTLIVLIALLACACSVQQAHEPDTKPYKTLTLSYKDA